MHHSTELENLKSVSSSPRLSELTQMLEALFSEKHIERRFKQNNFLEHAVKIVNTLTHLFKLASNPERVKWKSAHQIESSQADKLFDKIYEELNTIYEMLEDNGWQCQHTDKKGEYSQPIGLIKSSKQVALVSFLSVFNKTTLSSAVNIHKLSRQLDNIVEKNRQSSPLSSTPDELSITSDVDMSTACSSSSASSVITDFITEIKTGKSLAQISVIEQAPNLIYTTDVRCADLEELDFSPLFHATKYTHESKIFTTLIKHVPDKSNRLWVLRKTIKTVENPYFGASLLMFTAKYGTAEHLSELLGLLDSKAEDIHKVVAKNTHFKGWSALHFACCSSNRFHDNQLLATEKVKLLLSCNANINSITTGTAPKDALLLAIEQDNPALVALLMEKNIQTPFIKPELAHEKALVSNTNYPENHKANLLAYLKSNVQQSAQASSSSDSYVSKKRKEPNPINMPKESLFQLETDDKLKVNSESFVKQNIASQDFLIGKAVGYGDSFFDSFAQGLALIEPNTNMSIKGLRAICERQARKSICCHTLDNPSWFLHELKKEMQSQKTYLETISLDCTEMVEPICGRPYIEGRLLCDFFGVILNIFELHHIDGVPVINEYSLDKNGNPAETDARTIHLMWYLNTLHMVPLIPKTDQKALMEKNELERNLYLASHAMRLETHPELSKKTIEETLSKLKPSSSSSASSSECSEDQEQEPRSKYQRPRMNPSK